MYTYTAKWSILTLMNVGFIVHQHMNEHNVCILTIVLTDECALA